MMTETSAERVAPAAAPPAAGAQRPGRMLAVLLIALFMAQFDFFVVNVAAPSISRELHTGSAALELIVGGYAFAYASGLVTGGRLGDLYGFRRLFVLGMLAFALASLLCGLAQDTTQLVVARLLQGLTGALMVPQVLATITATFSPQERPKALGWFGVAGGLGSVSANVLGALLLDANVFGLGWRVIFLVNVPIAAVAVLLAPRVLPKLPAPRRSKLDPIGALGVAISLALLLVPLSLGNTEGWPTWSWVCLVLSVPAGAITVYWQRTLRARGGSPVLDLGLLKVRSYLSGVIAGAAFLAYFASFMFTLTQFLQSGFGLTPFLAGLVIVSSAVMFSTSSLVCFRLVPRYGLRVVVIGGLVCALAMLSLVVQLATMGAGVPLAGVIASIMLAGAGNGAVLPQLIGASMVRVKPQQAGIGAAMLNTAQQFGSSAGVAVVGAIFFAFVGPVTAGSSDAPGTFAHAMTVSTILDGVLILCVSALMAYNKRAADRVRKAG
jgi:MFS family permease